MFESLCLYELVVFHVIISKSDDYIATITKYSLNVSI